MALKRSGTKTKLKKDFSYVPNLVNEKDPGGPRRRKFSSRVLNIIETSKQIVAQTHCHAKVVFIHKKMMAL